MPPIPNRIMRAEQVAGGSGYPKPPKNKGDDPTDISHSRAYNKSVQFIPDIGNVGRTLGDIFGDQLSKARGRGGGGRGYDPYAAQRAADERRRAAQRAAIQQQFGGAITNLGGQNTAARGAMDRYYREAQGRMNPIYAQNKALTGQYSKQLAELAQNASRGVLDQGNMLARDLQGQGAGLGDLRGMISGDVRDILGARSAGDQYNTRLAQVMGLSQTDNSALLNALLQSGQSTRENAYAQELARLQAEQAMRLAELA